MLYFDPDQVEPIAKERLTCVLCRKRTATWKTPRKGGIEKEPMCAFCLLYMGSEWGHQNRAELLESGRAAQELAAKHDGDMPKLDKRRRLDPGKCEQYMLGIAYSSRFVRNALNRHRR